MICHNCKGTCRNNISETEFVEIECPICDGLGCEHCDAGHFRLTTCAQNFINREIVTAINMTNYADKGVMPVSGGLLDQSAWFVSLWSAVQREQNIITAERWKAV